MTTFYNHRNQNNTSDTPNSQQINYQFNENLDININTNTNEDYNLYNKIHNSQQNISVPLDNNTNNTNNTINDTNIENSNSNSNPFDESVVDSNNFTQETITKQEYEDCSFCLDELIEEVAILTCKHEYHLNCFMCWVSKCNTDRKDITCPQCMCNNCEIVSIVNKNNVYSYQNEYYSNYNKEQLTGQLTEQLTEQQSNISYIVSYNQQYDTYNNIDNNLLNNTSNIQQQSRKSIWKRFISFVSCKKI